MTEDLVIRMRARIEALEREYVAAAQAYRARIEALESALQGWHMAEDLLTGRIEVLEKALREIADLDPKMIRADDLGRAARIAAAALDKDEGK